MLGCSVMGCKSNTLRKIEGISFHTFPNDPEIRKLWRTATNRLNWDPPRGSRIYSRHFNKEDIVLLKRWKENISFSVPVKYGMFVGEDPTAAEHVAYTVRQYDKLDRIAKHKDRVAVMVSVSRSLPLLQLAALGPTYISPDGEGEADCRALFPVGYGDDYDEEIENEEILSAQMSVTAVN